MQFHHINQNIWCTFKHTRQEKKEGKGGGGVSEEGFLPVSLRRTETVFWFSLTPVSYVWLFCLFQNLLTSLCPCGVTTMTLCCGFCHTNTPKPCQKDTYCRLNMQQQTQGMLGARLLNHSVLLSKRNGLNSDL